MFEISSPKDFFVVTAGYFVGNILYLALKYAVMQWYIG